MAKKLEVKKQDFDSVLRRMMSSSPARLSSIEVAKKKPTKIIPPATYQPKSDKA